jgi:hypothetical protein
VDMDEVLNTGGICLVRIARDALGMETARLVGSIVVARTWQAATRRARVPQRQRRDCGLYVDEGISTNARSKIFFNASPEDAERLARHTMPRLSDHDLSNLGVYHSGRPGPSVPFSRNACGSLAYVAASRTT